MNAERLMLIGGISAFLLTIHWVRTRELREKYAVLWIGSALLLLLCGFFPGVIMGLADSAHLSYPALVLFVALAALYTFCFTVSVSLTRQYRRNARLTQEVAFLAYKLHQLETAMKDAAPPDPCVPGPPVAPSARRETTEEFLADLLRFEEEAKVWGVRVSG